MSTSYLEEPPLPELRLPARLARQGQPWWNPQLSFSPPTARYRRPEPQIAAAAVERRWPSRVIENAPLWCSVDLRDGNQALPNPMDPTRKSKLFALLVAMGFKEIEVGYPSASATDFDFVRQLVERDLIPDDVTISVFTPARAELIDRTFESLAGVRNAIVHLCNATAPEWRKVVFALDEERITQLALDAAERVLRGADRMPSAAVRFEYSPEAFNLTEPEFALALCNAVAARWCATPDRPVTLNLPSTVEVDTPNVYADQIEWMHRNLDNRGSIILSVHPHNDRGTAVASAELAMMAGADRVEGTLFGNGERTGNVCLVTLALNLLTRGIDPQLDFSDIDGIRRVVEWCTQMPVHDRHPYSGNLVYTAFSGTHQDAIKKGFDALEQAALKAGTAPGEQPWRVPYLPIDPQDLGRSYEAVVRINSQSGKGGIAYVLKTVFRLELPRPLQAELSEAVQKISDARGQEVGPKLLWEVFAEEYLKTDDYLRVTDHSGHPDDGDDRVCVHVLYTVDGREIHGEGAGIDQLSAFKVAMAQCGIQIETADVITQAARAEECGEIAAYSRVVTERGATWGAGLADNIGDAVLRALTSSVNRALRGSRTF
ncbi:2-isopropylmalate synthase [Micromonospora olivasterospora]|nr:2-isopropylmalate synthase [Micromonospora olivasterospora]